MIVGINYNTDGTRYIASIVFSHDWKLLKKVGVAQALTQDYDEVYVIKFNTSDKDVINEIVTNGCRIGV